MGATSRKTSASGIFGGGGNVVSKPNRKAHVPPKSSHQKALEIAESFKKWIQIELGDLKSVPVDVELCGSLSSRLMTGDH